MTAATSAVTSAGWRGELTLDYRVDTTDGVARCISHDRHSGPLRVLQPLYPEGPGICHHVLVHSPGGVVGGDELHIRATLGPGSHALLTTPGATRFYRSDGPQALQQTQLQLADGARLEWLPMETLAHSGCRADNVLRAELAPGAEMMGWDLLVLGLAAAEQPFAHGWYRQHLELPGHWLERARIAADDEQLLRGPLGWAGHTALATMWFAVGQPLQAARREALRDAARACVADSTCAATAGVTSPHAGVVVLRALGQRSETLMQLMVAVRAQWRQLAWSLPAAPPRIWRT